MASQGWGDENRRALLGEAGKALKRVLSTFKKNACRVGKIPLRQESAKCDHTAREAENNEKPRVGTAQRGSKWERSAERGQRACAVRARTRALPRPRAPALVKAHGRPEARAGGPRSLRLPERPRRSPAGVAAPP